MLLGYPGDYRNSGGSSGTAVGLDKEGQPKREVLASGGKKDF